MKSTPDKQIKGNEENLSNNFERLPYELYDMPYRDVINEIAKNILKFHDTGIKDLPAEILNLRKLKEVHGTTEFVYNSKISRKLQENNVDVYTFKYSAL